MSDDGTAEFCHKMPKTSVYNIDTNNEFRDDELIRVKNEEWKIHSRDVDWVICCDIDEIVYHPSMLSFLDKCTNMGTSLLQPFWYEMTDMEFPACEGSGLPLSQIYEIVKYGIPIQSGHKILLFSPKHIESINYDYGAHVCKPIGNVTLHTDIQLKTLHCQMIGLNRMMNRYKIIHQRNSEFNKSKGLSVHYKSVLQENFIKEWESLYATRQKVL
jgi:hypothetical protein